MHALYSTLQVIGKVVRECDLKIMMLWKGIVRSKQEQAALSLLFNLNHVHILQVSKLSIFKKKSTYLDRMQPEESR